MPIFTHKRKSSAERAPFRHHSDLAGLADGGGESARFSMLEHMVLNAEAPPNVSRGRPRSSGKGRMCTETGGACAPTSSLCVFDQPRGPTPSPGFLFLQSGTEQRDINVYPYVAGRLHEFGLRPDDITTILSTGVVLNQRHSFSCSYVRSYEQRLQAVIIVVFVGGSRLYVTDILDATNEHETRNVIPFPISTTPHGAVGKAYLQKKQSRRSPDHNKGRIQQPDVLGTTVSGKRPRSTPLSGDACKGSSYAATPEDNR